MTRLPRRLHAGAWWAWAAGLVAAATQTRNPLLLGAIVAVSALVVTARRPPTVWAGGYRWYLTVALVVVVVRVGFRVVFGGGAGHLTLFTLPRLDLPGGGVTLGGPVTVESTVAGLYDGLRLATIIALVGAANTLADPRRLVGALPRALGGVATSMVVALSIAPHLVESLHRVRRARRLRGETARGLRSLRSLLVPVLEDSLQRSLALAASMDSRGYGRQEGGPRWRRLAPGLAWVALVAIAGGIFALLTLPASWMGWLLVAVGVLLAGTVLAALGAGVVRTRYRPDPWGWPESVVAGCGLVTAAGVLVAGWLSPGALHPTVVPLVWPAAEPIALASIALAALPAAAAPPLSRPLPIPEGAPG